MVRIVSSYSAQPSTQKPNPFLALAVEHILRNELAPVESRGFSIADQGCGRLRHLPTLREHFKKIYLVDTEPQLSRTGTLFGSADTNIKDYIRSLRSRNLVVLSDREFSESALGLDIVFNICVFDVEVPRTRTQIIRAARLNLKEQGLYVVMIPRNDQSILTRCRVENRYLDGHIFRHHGVATFYKNYRDVRPLVRTLAKHGFTLEADLSRFRQVCVILRKTPATAAA